MTDGPQGIVHRRVVIIGGGAIGSSLAYWLTREAGAAAVTVLERDPSYARASSALSASSIRQQFSQAINVRLGLAGIAFLRRHADALAVDGEVPDLGLHEGGYLFLATAAGLATLEHNHALPRACSADVVLMDGPTRRQGRRHHTPLVKPSTLPLSVGS